MEDKLNALHEVWVNDGCRVNIPNPASFSHGCAVWLYNKGRNPKQNRIDAARLIESYDDILSDKITAKEAIIRLRIMRRTRKELCAELT